MMLAKCMQAVMPSLLHRGGAAITTTTCLRGLDELIPTVLKEGEQPVVGRAWQAQDLRTKSWDDLHKLWFVLLKERNKLHSEKLAYRSIKQQMPDPGRVTKVRKGMARIKAVMAERLREHDDPVVKVQLKAFIDAM